MNLRTKADTSYCSSNYASTQRSGIVGWGNSLVDRQIERFTRRAASARVLEIGASSGEHFEFVPAEPEIATYGALDLTPGIADLSLAVELRDAGKVVFIAANAASLPFGNACFNLSLSTCMLANVANPEQVLRELCQVTRPGGTVVVGMPCNPGVDNRLAKVLTTYRVLRRAGVEDPRFLYAREHVHSVGNLIALARHVFGEDRVARRFFPLLLPSWNVNLVVTLHVTEVNQVTG